VKAAIMEHRRKFLGALINHSMKYGLAPITERRSKTILSYYDLYSAIRF